MNNRTHISTQTIAYTIRGTTYNGKYRIDKNAAINNIGTKIANKHIPIKIISNPKYSFFVFIS